MSMAAMCIRTYPLDTSTYFLDTSTYLLDTSTYSCTFFTPAPHNLMTS